jgi:Zn-finger nucleic acid-binding protein
MPDEKDRLKDTLHKKEKAEEDRYFAKREKEIIEKLRGELSQTQVQDIRKFAVDRCPRCVENLVEKKELGVVMDRCPNGHGIWLDDGELQALAGREHETWIGRLFFRAKPRKKEKDAEEEKRKLGEKLRGELTKTQVEEVRAIATGRCPRCLEKLVEKKELGVTIDQCPSGHGVWFDDGELETLAERERDSWIGRLFFRPKR